MLGDSLSTDNYYDIQSFMSKSFSSRAPNKSQTR
jgi:hypothetical protein